MSQSIEKRPTFSWHIAALCVLVALALYTRFYQALTHSVANDEMHHLESWRNRYGTDDIYPLFMQKVESSGVFSGERLELLKKVYASSPLVQRGLIVLVDPQPPTFPVLAEAIQATTDSSLIAIRMVSVVASLLTVLVAYRLGCELRDRSLGLWLATLFCIGHLTQVYGGQGRAYALAQFALILAIYLFVRRRVETSQGPQRYLASAMFAQSTQWLVWAIIGPMSLIDLVREFLERRSLHAIIRRWWWYCLLSIALLAYMAVQFINPQHDGIVRVSTLGEIWKYFEIASPFATVDTAIRSVPLRIAGPLMVVLGVIGLGALVTWRHLTGRVRLALAATLFTSILAPLAISVEIRFMVTYIVVPTIFVGIGIVRLLPWPRIADTAALVTLLAFGASRPSRRNRRTSACCRKIATIA